MSISTGEFGENYKLQQLVHILSQKNQKEDDGDGKFGDSSDEDRDYESQLSQDEDDLLIDDTSTWTMPTTSSNIATASQVGHFADLLTSVMSVVSFEEYELISECKDVALKQLLVLNRTKHVELTELINKCRDLLFDTECCLRFNCETRQSDDLKVKCNSKLNRIAYPYFHVKQYGPACNADYYRKKRNCELNVMHPPPGKMRLTDMFGNKLRTCVIFSYFTNNLIAHGSKLEQLRVSKDGDAEITTENIAHQERQIGDFENDLGNVEAMNRRCPDLWDDTYITWNTIAENDFKDVACSSSLRAIWNYYLHPKINRSYFTAEENARLIDLAGQSDQPDWSAIASLLQTNRSEHQLVTHYMSTLRTRDDSAAPSPHMETAQRLHKEVENPRLKPAWNNMSYQLDDMKARTQIYSRFKYYKSTKGRKMGRFTMAEDVKIVRLVRRFGPDQFERISEMMPHRSKAQIKYRYTQNLRHSQLEYGNWKMEDDQRIVRHVDEHGEQNWQQLADFMPTRNSAQLRHRYNVIKKHLSSGDINAIPRRTHLYTQKIKKKRETNMIAHTNIDPTEILIRAPDHMRSFVDADILEFFAPTAQLKPTRSMKQIRDEQLNDCASTIQQVLCMFNASNLDIPPDLSGIDGLDSIDEEVLSILRAKEGNAMPNGDSSLMPPNLSSMQALRYLLLRTIDSGADDDEDPDPKANKTQIASGRGRTSVSKFIDRFNQFILWPSLMSIVDLPEAAVAAAEATTANDDEQLSSTKRRVGRPRKNNTKIMKMAAAKRAERQPNPQFNDDTNQVVKLALPANATAAAQLAKRKPLILMKVVDKATIQRIRAQNQLKAKTAASCTLTFETDSTAQLKPALEKRKIETTTDEMPSTSRPKLLKQYTRRKTHA